MNPCIITGLSGTLAPHLARAVAARGGEVARWDRAAVDPGDTVACLAWLRTMRPCAIAHLAMGSPAWAGQLAGYAHDAGIPFVFTSTAMVFHHDPDGPHDVASERTARDEYGLYKITCEDAVRAANPAAHVARIGWQIDPHTPGNNMLMALDAWQAKEGQVAASRLWRPACSFMQDTAEALAAMLAAPHARGGTFHLDSNAGEGHAFDAIVRALKAALGRDAWVVRAHDEYRHDQRLVGGACSLPPLSARLPLERAR